MKTGCGCYTFKKKINSAHKDAKAQRTHIAFLCEIFASLRLCVRLLFFDFVILKKVGSTGLEVFATSFLKKKKAPHARNQHSKSTRGFARTNGMSHRVRHARNAGS